MKNTRPVYILSIICSLIIVTTSYNNVQAASCCRVTVEGCSKKAKVCLPESCSLSTEKKARNKFEKAYNCKSSRVKSHIGTCSGEKCELDLR